MIGERLAAARRAAGFRSQQSLADRLHVSRETVSRAERAKTEDDLGLVSSTLLAWARECGVSVDALISEDASTAPTVTTESAPASPAVADETRGAA